MALCRICPVGPIGTIFTVQSEVLQMYPLCRPQDGWIGCDCCGHTGQWGWLPACLAVWFIHNCCGCLSGQGWSSPNLSSRPGCNCYGYTGGWSWSLAQLSVRLGHDCCRNTDMQGWSPRGRSCFGGVPILAGATNQVGQGGSHFGETSQTRPGRLGRVGLQENAGTELTALARLTESRNGGCQNQAS